MFKKPAVTITVGVLSVLMLVGAGYFFLSGNKFGVEYRNESYGFAVALPETWRGFTVTLDAWAGMTIADASGERPFTDGPFVHIHNPKWSGLNTYQDIPVMIFTLDQWNQLQQEQFHIGAAPIGPSELGRNSRYVVALPARYNFAFPPGYEEVDNIIQSKPLIAF